jgi:hypothetical protein
MTPTDTESQSIRRLIAMFALTGFATSLIIRVTDPLVAVIAEDLTTSVGTVSADCWTIDSSESHPTAIIFCSLPSRSSGVPLVVLPSGLS